jgi:hypothetical protein
MAARSVNDAGPSGFRAEDAPAGGESTNAQSAAAPEIRGEAEWVPRGWVEPHLVIYRAFADVVSFLA